MTKIISVKIRNWVAGSILSPKAGDRILQWLTDIDSAAFIEEIQALVKAENTDKLEDIFGTTITFGTGGIRGRMGPGPNCVNTRTVGAAAQGLAQYLSGIDKIKNDLSRNNVETTKVGCWYRAVVVAWDTRINSKLFAKEAARVLAANDIPVKIFDGYRSTPELSFTIRDLRAMAGVMISASHNPPNDNGFKIYFDHGGQVVAPLDEAIAHQIGCVNEIRHLDYETAIRSGLIQTIGEDVDERYVNVLSEMTLADTRSIRLVYTPLHGVGMTSVASALEKLGYKDIHYVDEQIVPDGYFGTLNQGIANPETPEVFELGIRKASDIQADLVLASDPDADRIGIALPLPECGWAASTAELALDGNQISALLCHYILTQRQATGTLPKKGLFCKTVTTSDLSAIIARSFGLEVKDDLPVGFKHISSAIEKMSREMTFVFGAEESHGYLADTRIRDKEAATGILLAEYAALSKLENRTLRDELDDIYNTYGYFKEVKKSVSLDLGGKHKSAELIMEYLRSSPPPQIGGYTVFSLIDRKKHEILDLRTKIKTRAEGERTNILIFNFSTIGYTRVIVRPSGTEGSIKYYVSATEIDQYPSKEHGMAQNRLAIDCMAEHLLDAIVEICANISYNKLI